MYVAINARRINMDLVKQYYIPTFKPGTDVKPTIRFEYELHTMVMDLYFDSTEKRDEVLKKLDRLMKPKILTK